MKERAEDRGAGVGEGKGEGSRGSVGEASGKRGTTGGARVRQITGRRRLRRGGVEAVKNGADVRARFGAFTALALAGARVRSCTRRHDIWRALTGPFPVLRMRSDL